jgi:hypothetical protein
MLSLIILCTALPCAATESVTAVTSDIHAELLVAKIIAELCPSNDEYLDDKEYHCDNMKKIFTHVLTMRTLPENNFQTSYHVEKAAELSGKTSEETLEYTEQWNASLQVLVPAKKEESVSNVQSAATRILKCESLTECAGLIKP